MKQIQFIFAGVALGPFSVDQVRRYIREGYLSLADLARYEDTTEWLPLQEILAGFPLSEIEFRRDTSPAAATRKIQMRPSRPARVRRQARRQEPSAIPVPRIVPPRVRIVS